MCHPQFRGCASKPCQGAESEVSRLGQNREILQSAVTTFACILSGDGTQGGDAGNRISSPEWGPRPKWNAHPCWVRVRQSGDAGNRTRVRKNRPSEIYERSRSKVVTTGISSGTNRLQPAALSFARVAASGAALRVCLARAGPWRRSGPVDGSHE